MNAQRASAALSAFLLVLLGAGAAQAGNPHGTPPGQAKQSEGAQSSSASGVKPDSTTQHDTSCSTGGGQGTAATCSSSTSSNPDASKRYGNGKTAAQIANGRGAPAGTLIKGPGNSQPHKVCRNGHWVDVHAVKSYSASTTCAPAESAVQVESANHANSANRSNSQSAEHSASCTCSAENSTSSSNTSSSSSNTSASSENSSASNTSNGVASTSSNSSNATNQTSSSSQQSGAAVAASPAPARVSASSAPAASGVLGASHTLRGAAAPARASLVARVARATLPFTGLPLWLPVLLGVALLGGGLALVRASKSPSEL